MPQNRCGSFKEEQTNSRMGHTVRDYIQYPYYTVLYITLIEWIGIDPSVSSAITQLIYETRTALPLNSIGICSGNRIDWHWAELWANSAAQQLLCDLRFVSLPLLYFHYVVMHFEGWGFGYSRRRDENWWYTPTAYLRFRMHTRRIDSNALCIGVCWDDLSTAVARIGSLV